MFQRLLYELDLKQRLKWALHNGVAHPLMVVLPRKLADKVHDATIPRSERLKASP